MSKLTNRDYIAFKNDFIESVNKFFGKCVSIDERVLRSVCVWRGSSIHAAKHPRPLHIWSALEHEIPIIHQLYESLGVAEARVNEMGFPNADRRIITQDMYNSKSFLWAETLESIFGNPFSNSFTSSGTRVKATAHLGVNELVTALLDYNDEQAQTSRTPYIRLKGTLLSQLARRNKEFSREHNWRKSFSEKAIKKWSEIYDLDQSLGNQQFVIWNDGDVNRVSPFTVFGGFSLAESIEHENQTFHVRGNVLEPVSIAVEEQANELEALINSKSNEHMFQEFFEKHPEFLTSIGPYQNIHSQLVLHKDNGERLIPDFFLEHLDSRFCDLCELKLPSKELVRNQKNRLRFRDAIDEGISQLKHYRDWFEQDGNRDSFFNLYGIESYRPRAVLIIGRQASFSSDMQRLHLESDLPNWFQLLTYDDVLTRVRNWKNAKFN